MENPFEVINDRLDAIEKLLLEIMDNISKSKSENISEEILNVEQVAKLLDLSVPTIYDKVRKAELPVMKRSKRLYFSTKDILKYLKAGRKKTNAEIEAEANQYLSNKKRKR